MRDCSPIETVMQTKKTKRKYLQKLLKESDGQWLGTVVQSQGKGKLWFKKYMPNRKGKLGQC